MRVDTVANSATRQGSVSSSDVVDDLWVLQRQTELFSRGVTLIEVKARRSSAPRCPECGRRGYCLRVCRRHGFTVELRWQYVAHLVFSSGGAMA